MLFFNAHGYAFQKVVSGSFPKVHVGNLSEFGSSDRVKLFQVIEPMFGADDARNDIFGVQTFVAKQTFIGGIHVGSVDDFNDVFDANEWGLFELVKKTVNDRFVG